MKIWTFGSVLLSTGAILASCGGASSIGGSEIQWSVSSTTEAPVTTASYGLVGLFGCALP